MRNTVRSSVSVLALGLAAGAFAVGAAAQTASRDGIGDLLKSTPDAATQLAQSQAGGQKTGPGTPSTSGATQAGPDKQATPEKDVREGDPGYEQAQRLIGELVRMSSNLDALRLLKTALGALDQRDGR